MLRSLPVVTLVSVAWFINMWLMRRRYRKLLKVAILGLRDANQRLHDRAELGGQALQALSQIEKTINPKY